MPELDLTALHLEHEQPATGTGDDEVALPFPLVAHPQPKRVPRTPARQLRLRERYVEVTLRLAGRAGAHALCTGPAALVQAVVDRLRSLGAAVATGRFRAEMRVALVNDGPVTVIIDV